MAEEDDFMIRQPYGQPPEPMQSYDYLDYVSGLGYRNMYAAVASISGANLYFLTNQAIDSDYAARTLGAEATWDFDQTFSTPAIIGGDAISNFTFKNLNSPATIYFTNKLFLVRNGIETEIGAVISSTYTGATTARVCLKMSVTRTSIAIGDILRFKFTTNSGNGISVYADPNSRVNLTESTTGATIPTSLIIKIPYIIDT